MRSKKNKSLLGIGVRPKVRPRSTHKTMHVNSVSLPAQIYCITRNCLFIFSVKLTVLAVEFAGEKDWSGYITE